MKQHLIGLVTGIGALVPFAVESAKATSAKATSENAIEQGNMLEPGQLSAGYNYPAAYKLSAGWDFFITGDYIFWMANQENMQFPGVVINPVETGLGYNGKYVQFRPLHTTFKSGFKAGFGWQMPSVDHWIIGCEYTWYHNTFSDSLTVAQSATPTPGALSYAQNIVDASFFQTLQVNNLLIGDVSGTTTSPLTLREKWELRVDIVDGKFERPYYLGARLLVNPEAGVRGMWIEQTIRYINTSATANATTQIKYHSNNWGVGPRFAMRANWFLGKGFSFISKAGASVLFTQYNEISRVDNNLNGTSPQYRPDGAINVLRPQIETGLGCQLGGYCCSNSVHVDLAVTYDFNVFLNQNEAFSFLSGVSIGGASDPGSLYLHGLTARAGLDF